MIITIKKNSINTIALTLSEKSTVQNADWILMLIDDVVGLPSQKVIPLIDISTPPSRANIFQIEESQNEDLYRSIVSLSPTGQWTYKALEMPTSSPRDLNPSHAISVLEYGRCSVINPNETKNNFFDQDDKKKSPVFEG